MFRDGSREKVVAFIAALLLLDTDFFGAQLDVETIRFQVVTRIKANPRTRALLMVVVVVVSPYCVPRSFTQNRVLKWVK